GLLFTGFEQGDQAPDRDEQHQADRDGPGRVDQPHHNQCGDDQQQNQQAGQDAFAGEMDLHSCSFRIEWWACLSPYMRSSADASSADSSAEWLGAVITPSAMDAVIGWPSTSVSASTAVR